MKSKKAKNGEGSIRKRVDGRWEFRIQIDGKTKSFYAKTKAEILRKKKEIKIYTDEGIDYNAPHMPFAQWLEIWRREYTLSIKPATAYRYNTDIRVHIIPSLGKLPICSIRTTHLQAFYRKKLSEGLSAKSIKNLHVLDGSKDSDIHSLASNDGDGASELLQEIFVLEKDYRTAIELLDLNEGFTFEKLVSVTGILSYLANLIYINPEWLDARKSDRFKTSLIVD